MQRVGVIDDPIFDSHRTGSHPENAGRLAAIRMAIANSEARRAIVPLAFRPATEEELALAHAERHIARIRQIADRGGAWIDGDTIVTEASYDVAVHAAGAAARAVEAVLSGELPTAFALVRPPGHHATPDRAMGFCLFNNAAIAALVARERFGIERTLLIDFDVHHGNGTQDIFYRDPSVFYFSVHQWPLFPGTGRVDEVGEGAGYRTTANVPLPPNCGDDVYRAVFDDVLVPLARRYHPQLVIVSAGYDAYWADPLASERLTIEGFAHLVRVCRAIAEEHCGGRLAVTLEGGYNPKGLGAGVVATIAELAGCREVNEPIPPPDLRGAPDVRGLIDRVRALHGV
ncbi:MAG: histone deacetylase [Chloroflexota bacterium]|nr:histone deacetylase [Dehalococcoidia bacterium]MDW8254894.1 histone deacetylase [Chloroflexota bacterium]